MIFGCWNVRALNGKEVELTEEMEKSKVDMLAITETKKKGQGVEYIGPNHILIFSGVNVKDRARAGVGLIVHKKLEAIVEDWKFISPRLLEVNIKPKDRDIKLLIAYGPNEDATKEDKDSFENNLQLSAENLKPNQELMVLGDLNARVGNNVETAFGVIGKEGEETISPNGERLLDFCLRNNMKIANTFFPHKNIHKYTRENEDRSEKSIIDYIVVSNSLFYSTMDVKVSRGAEIYSDHYLVRAKMRILIEGSKQKKMEKKVSRLKIEKLNKPDVKQLYQAMIKTCLDEEQADFSKYTLEEKWKVYMHTLKNCAEEVCGRKQIKGNGKRTAWWNDNVKCKIKEKKEAWQKYIQTRLPSDRAEYVKRRTIAKEEVRKAKQEQWEDFGEKLQESHQGNQKLFWGAMKSLKKTKACPIRQIKDAKGNTVKKEHEILEIWREYFQDLHNPATYETRSKERKERESNQGETHEDSDITIEEVQKAIKKVKVGKSPGADEIYPEMIKNQGREADKLLHAIIQDSWKLKQVPQDWRKGIIVPIHKKGSTMECSNYRGISMLSVPGKVYARILEMRLREQVEDQLKEEQSGFRPGRSVQDHIFTIRQVTEKFLEKNLDLHLCFVDLEKAFDTVKRDELWNSLREHNIGQNLIEAVQGFYNNPTCAVRVAGSLSKDFEVGIGVRQGCILSPLLFIIYMNSVAKACSNMKKMNVGMWKLKAVNLTTLSFADDLVLFANSERDLHNNINILNSELNKRGMKINAKKTKTMLISREAKVHKLKLGREELEQVENYKYLGVMINQDGRLRDEISQRIKKATAVYHQLGNAFIGKKELTTKTKMAVYNTVYCPTLLYGSETWTLDNRECSRVQAAEMRYLRRVVGKTKRDKVRNTIIRDQTKTEAVKTKIEINQLRWFGHVKRMNDNRIAKSIYNARTQGKRPKGRPRRKWEEDIKDALKKRNLTLTEGNRKCQDRGGWRKIITGF